MDAKAAFESICNALRREPNRRLVDAHYYEECFGNFIINFEDDGRPMSIINDRFELVLSKGFGGNDPGKAVLRSIRDADEQTIINSLGL